MTASSTPRRPLHHSLMAILFPPLAHWHHGRYAGKTHHFVFDSLLNAVMLGVAGWVILLFAFAPIDQRLGVRWNIPSLVSGQSAEISISIQNQSGRNISDITGHLELPDGWVASSLPLKVAHLDPDQQSTIVFEVVPLGTLHRASSLHLVLDGMIGHSAFAQIDAVQVRLETSVVEVQYRTPDTLTTGQPSTAILTIRNTTGEDQVVNITQHVPSGLTVGSSSKPMTNSGWENVHLSPQSTTDIIMTWNAAVQTSIVVRPDAQALIRIGGQMAVVSSATTSITLLPTQAPSTVINQAEQLVAALSAQAQYVSANGIQFGYGAFPLQVGQQTTLRVFINVRPSQSSATSAVVTTTLPAGVRWAGNASVSAGSTVSYNTSTRQVRWDLGNWSSQNTTLTGSFDVQITPTASQIGSYPVLTGSFRLQYTDSSRALQVVTTSAATTKTANLASPSDGKVRK